MSDMLALPRATVERILALLEDANTNSARNLCNEVRQEIRPVSAEPRPAVPIKNQAR